MREVTAASRIEEMRDGSLRRLLGTPISRYIQNSSSSSSPPLKPNSNSIAAFLQLFIDSDSPSKGRSLHADLIKAGTRCNTNISIKLLILHLKCWSIANARHVFDRMPKPTLSAFNYMIAGYFKRGSAEKSLDLVRKLTFSDGRADGFTLSMVLKISVMLTSLDVARQAHAQIIRLGFYSDDVVLAALIDSYVKNEKLGYAKGVFDAMPERNLICSTALIVGYLNHGATGDAEEVFRSLKEKDIVVFNAMIEGYSKTIDTAGSSLQVYKNMQMVGFRPTLSTFVSVIGACSLLSVMEFGQQVHAQMMKLDLSSDVKSGSALVDMYSKCGKVDEARQAFNRMPERNVISWTSMIDGYGKNGMPNKAIDLFYQMKLSQNIRPNHATFLSALSACAHAGLVSAGREIFESMEKDFLLAPRMEHYACMVDLLGRCGFLKEAHDFVRRIPGKPNSDVWTALLGASRLHGNLEIADIAAKEVFNMRESRPGAYMALSNAFASVEKWQGVAEVRQLMKQRDVSKDVGRSWIGTDEGPCNFRALQR